MYNPENDLRTTDNRVNEIRRVVEVFIYNNKVKCLLFLLAVFIIYWTDLNVSVIYRPDLNSVVELWMITEDKGFIGDSFPSGT